MLESVLAALPTVIAIAKWAIPTAVAIVAAIKAKQWRDAGRAAIIGIETMPDPVKARAAQFYKEQLEKQFGAASASQIDAMVQKLLEAGQQYVKESVTATSYAQGGYINADRVHAIVQRAVAAEAQLQADRVAARAAAKPSAEAGK